MSTIQSLMTLIKTPHNNQPAPNTELIRNVNFLVIPPPPGPAPVIAPPAPAFVPPPGIPFWFPACVTFLSTVCAGSSYLFDRVIRLQTPSYLEAQDLLSRSQNLNETATQMGVQNIDLLIQNPQMGFALPFDVQKILQEIRDVQPALVSSNITIEFHDRADLCLSVFSFFAIVMGVVVVSSQHTHFGPAAMASLGALLVTTASAMDIDSDLVKSGFALAAAACSLAAISNSQNSLTGAFIGPVLTGVIIAMVNHFLG